jgi:hypothetical protein
MDFKTRIARYLNGRKWAKAKWPGVNEMATVWSQYLDVIAKDKLGKKGETIMRLNKDGSIDIIWRERIFTP